MRSDTLVILSNPPGFLPSDAGLQFTNVVDDSWATPLLFIFQKNQMICKHCNAVCRREWLTQEYCSHSCKDKQYRAKKMAEVSHTLETSGYSESIKRYLKAGGKVQRLPPEQPPPKWEYLAEFYDDDQVAPI